MKGCGDRISSGEPAPEFLYVGGEFCERLLPSPACLRRLKKTFPSSKLVLLTPVLSQPALESLLATLATCAREGLLWEVCANDLGLFHALLARGDRPHPGVGRLLANTLGVSMQHGQVKKSLLSPRVAGIEADSLETLSFLDGALRRKVHLRAPFSYLGHTRDCRFRAAGRCGRQCLSEPLRLRSGIVGEMFLAGNAYLRDNRNETARIMKQVRVKRLVLERGPAKATAEPPRPQ